MLDYKVRGENIKVTEALHDYIAKRLDKLNRYIDVDATANVNVRTYNSDKSGKVEVTIVLPYIVLRAEQTSADLYESVDKVSEKLERQIRKHKTKINRKSREKGYKGIQELDSVPAVAEEEQATIEIVRTKTFDLKPMSVEEAALQMDLLGHSFFVFEDADSESTNIVYKREDGKFGLIETK